ncbi:MAG: Ku protein, partial [bacterium]|nr:Ku protein [bacterium]
MKQKLHCPVCERTVERKELVKGFEYAKDAYVPVEDAEIKKLAPASARSMEILEFVKLEEVDPLHFDSSYYAVPDEPGRKPYHLLVKSMEESGYAAIAKLAMHQREYTVLIRPRAGGLTLHSMYCKADIRQVAEYGQNGDIEVKPQELALARKLVDGLASTFDPEKYEDGYQVKLREMIEAKQKGEAVTAAEQPRLAPV